MKFTLVFDGDLPPTANGTRKKAEKKWDIRKKLHPQLEELHRTHPMLKSFAEDGHWVSARGPIHIVSFHHSTALKPADYYGPESREDMTNLYDVKQVCGKGFIPLVRESLALTCGLRIVFLRKEEPGSLILDGGDIDNRIKTLFDALKMPDIDDFVEDAESPDPMFCLLENDSLITSVEVRTERLLLPMGAKPTEARLYIDVDVRLARAELYNFNFLSD